MLCTVAEKGIAQNCDPGMLSISRTGSYIAIADKGKLNLQRSFTIECWAKVFNSSPNASLIERADTNDKVYWSLGFGSSFALVGKVGSTPAVVLTSPDVSNVFTWHHYAVTYSVGDSIRFYLDGKWNASVASNTSPIAQNADSIRIGISTLSSTSFIGDIDEVRIWDTTQTEVQITKRKDSVLRGKLNHLVAYYALDDLPGTSRVHDFSGNGNDGFLKGDDATIQLSTSPVKGQTPGFKIESLEKSVQFPLTVCQNSYDTVIHVRDIGYEQVTIAAAMLHGAHFSVANNIFTLPADTTIRADIHIHFTTASAGTFEDTLVVSGSTACVGAILIPLKATHDSAGVTFLTQEIQFGNRIPCQLPAVKQIRLQNTGTKKVTVSALQFLQAQGLKVLAPKVPFDLQPGKDSVVTILMDSTAPKRFATELRAQIEECNHIARLPISGGRDSIALFVPAHTQLPTLSARPSGITVDTVIQIINTGDVPLLITSVALTQDFNFKLLQPFTAVSLQPNTSITIPIEFTTKKCGDFRNIFRVQTNSCNYTRFDTISITVLEPNVQPIYNTYDLGNTCGTKDTIVTLVNREAYDVTITGFNTSYVGAVDVSLNEFPRTIPAGETASFLVHFQPPQAGDYVALLSFLGDPCGSFTTTIVGSSGLKQIRFDHQGLNFGKGCDLSVRSQSITIANTSSRSVRFANPVFFGTTNFSLSNISFPFDLAAGTSKTFTITYTPILNTRENGTLTFFSDDGCSTIPISLTGSREKSGAVWRSSIADLGTVCPNTTAQLTVEIENRGLDTINVVNAFYTGDAILTLTSSPTILANGSIEKFTFTVAPHTYGNYSGILTVRVGPCDDVLTVPVHVSAGPPPHVTYSLHRIDFDSVRVGDTVEACMDVVNLSCDPLTLKASDFTILNPSFSLSSRDTLPLLLEKDSVHQLCFRYTPSTRGSDSLYLVNTAGALDTLTLTGYGVAPEVIVKESSIDFGEVRLNETRSLALHFKNIGDLATAVTTSALSVPFSSIAYSSSLPMGKDDSIIITFTPFYRGKFNDTLTLSWQGGIFNVPVLGKGIEHGPVSASDTLNFGNVRLHTTSSLNVRIAGSSEGPISVTSVDLLSPADAVVFHISPTTFSLAGEQDTITLLVEFTPLSEQAYHTTLTLKNSLHDGVIELQGVGIEAHAHVAPDTIDFGKVSLNTAKTRTINITNAGSFPLSVSSASTVLPFAIDVTDPTDSIAANEQRPYSVSFSPVTQGVFTDSVLITVDDPQKVYIVYLRGRGVIGDTDRADVRYHVASVALRSGDKIALPITMTGIDSGTILLDTLRMTISYDPAMLFPIGVTPTASLSGWSVSTVKQDSSIELLAAGPVVRLQLPVTIATLNAEALLGPTRETKVFLSKAIPGNSVGPLSDTGSFTVTDCNGASPEVGMHSATKITSIRPNPADKNGVIEYDLGLAGTVTIELYDPLGKLVRTVRLEGQSAGHYTLPLPTDQLANGRYLCIFTFYDHIEKRAIIIAH